MICPICKSTFETINVGDFEMDKCSNCKTIWFDYQEFETYYETDYTIIDIFKPNDFSYSKTCPKCTGHKLLKGSANSIELMFCKRCSGVLVTHYQLSKQNQNESNFDMTDLIDLPLDLLNLVADIFDIID